MTGRDVVIASAWFSKYVFPVNSISQLAAALLVFGVATAAHAEAKISKVLPHWLDKKGRHTLSPSLFERDAYQAQLRANPDQRSGIRFDVKWSGSSSELKLMVELQIADAAKPVVLSQPLKAGRRGGWSAVTLDGERFKSLGKIVAWRASLLEGDKTLAERKSFLWPRETPSKKAAD